MPSVLSSSLRARAGRRLALAALPLVPLAVVGAAPPAPERWLASAPGGGLGAATRRQVVGHRTTRASCRRTELAAGITTFAITNAGSQVTEVYVYAEGDRIVTEKENIGPGNELTSLAVDLAQRAQVACSRAWSATASGRAGSGRRSGRGRRGPGGDEGGRRDCGVRPEQADTAGSGRHRVRRARRRGGRRGQGQELYAISRVPCEAHQPVAGASATSTRAWTPREADLGRATFSPAGAAGGGPAGRAGLAPLLRRRGQLLTDSGPRPAGRERRRSRSRRSATAARSCWTRSRLARSPAGASRAPTSTASRATSKSSQGLRGAAPAGAPGQ